MIEEQAVVVEIKGEQALLQIQRSQPCGLCGATQGCGLSIWGRFFSRRRDKFSASNQLDAKVGERVVVGVEEGALLSSALVSYGLPLVLLLGGSAFGSSLTSTHSDLYAAVGAAVGLLAGLLLVRLYSAGKRLSGRYRPVMLRRATAEPMRI